MLGALSTAIGPLDLAIVAIYLLVTTLLGIMLGRGQQDNRDYFLGGHRLPTWALLISIVATETSTVTFLSVPGLSYQEGGNFTFLQIAIGYIIGRIAIVIWLLPSYFRGDMLTAYEVLQQRFGVTTRRVASLVFLVTRNLADGLRLFLTALAIHIAIGVDMMTCILVTAIATAIYTFFGGVRSVVWNDCIQFAVYMVAALAAVWLLMTRIPGGWEGVTEFAQDTGRWKMFDFDPLGTNSSDASLGWLGALKASLTKSSITFWSGLFGGAFLSLATHGADQLIVQRYLCAKSQRAAAWALILSGVVVFAQFAIFLLIGVQLAAFQATVGIGGADIAGDEAFMTFVMNHMAVGFKGLILAAVLAAAMSTLSGSLNSSASSILGDWLGPVVARLNDRQALALARALTLAFALIQSAVAIGAYTMALEETVAAVLKIAGFSTGLLLGLYGLGLFVVRASELVALTSFVVGTLVTCGVAFGTPLSGWWYALVGSSSTFVVGWLLSMFFPRMDEATKVE